MIDSKELKKTIPHCRTNMDEEFWQFNVTDLDIEIRLAVAESMNLWGSDFGIWVRTANK